MIDACAENKVSIEINANPWRLDLDWRWIHYALEKEVILSINPDAHEIAGFDDMGFTAYLTPALTTVLRPVEEMNQEGAQIILNKIEGDDPRELGIINLDTKLIIRDSVRKL